MIARFLTGEDMHEVLYDVIDSKTVRGTTYYRIKNDEDEAVAVLNGTHFAYCIDLTVDDIF